MATIEFAVTNNISLAEGQAEGFFGVGRHIQIQECLNGLKDAGRSERRCIPIITDEFGIGWDLGILIGSHQKMVSGMVTFGAYESQSHEPLKTHLAMMAREIAKSNPTFLATMCRWPEGMWRTEWLESQPLNDLHLRYGSVMVQGNICTVEVDPFKTL